MSKKLNAAQLYQIRRMRKARRLHKQMPLFAFHLLCAEYPDYSYQQFLADLRYRRPRKRKPKKCNTHRYGRYSRMMQLVEQYKNSGNEKDGLQAMKLNKILRKPYTVLVRIANEPTAFRFSPMIPIARIESLVKALNQAATDMEKMTLINAFDQYSHAL